MKVGTKSNSVMNEGSHNTNIFSSIKKKISGHIKDLGTLFKIPNNHEAWDKFSPEAQQEMLKSLKEKDKFDLYSIDLTDSCIFEPTNKGDIPDFKEGIVQRDKIGNYIMINGMKCREYQPGISGFVYENINDRYHRFNWLKVGFCEKGTFLKSVNLNEIGKIPTFNLPDDINEELGGPFYIANHIISEGPLANITSQDVFNFKMKDNTERAFHEIMTGKYDAKSNIEHSANWIETEEGTLLEINGTVFKPFKKGVSGLIYKKIPGDSKYYAEYKNGEIKYESDNIILAEYKGGEIVGEGVVFNPYSYCVIHKKPK